MTEYNIILSTTEPNNNVGIVKLRHADVNSQYIVAQIVENGQPKNFEGLQPFFCLMAQEITGQGVSEEKVISFNAPKGTLKYISSDNALQMVGRNEAYFSFRKQVGEKWIEQFSTRTFHYIVEKSIYSQPFKDSNYWWTFKELYRIFNQYIDDGKISWEEFVNQNKEIIQSVDPGGVLLTRLGIFSSFRDWDFSILEKVKNEFEERGVNVKWFGAKGDGETDDTQAIQTALDKNKNVYLPAGKYLISSLKLNLNNRISGESKESTFVLANNQGDYAIQADLSSGAIVVENMTLTCNAGVSTSKAGIVMSNNGTRISQDTNSKILNLFVENFNDGITIGSSHRGVLIRDTICGMCNRDGFRLSGTDNEFISCSAAMCGEYGFRVETSNCRFISCKAFVCGRGMVRGSGFFLKGSFNNFSSCESQENRFHDLFMWNATNNLLNGFILDGAGAHNPDKTYTDPDFSNQTVQTSNLRMHNCTQNIMTLSIINGRTVSGQVWSASKAIYSLYPKLDKNNTINIILSDELNNTNYPPNFLENMYYYAKNKIDVNTRSLNDYATRTLSDFYLMNVTGSVTLSNNYNKAVFTVDTSKSDEPTLDINLSNTCRYVAVTSEMYGGDTDNIEVVSDVLFSYIDSAGATKYSNTTYHSLFDGSASVNVLDKIKSISDISSIRFLKLRLRCIRKKSNVGVNSITIQNIKVLEI